MEWKDVTSWSQSDKDRSEAQAWELKSKYIRLTVHRYLVLDGWFLTCNHAGVFVRKLDSENIADAKEEALRIVRKRLAIMLAAVTEDP